MKRLATAFAYLFLTLGVVGTGHTGWLDSEIGDTGLALELQAGVWRVVEGTPGSAAERAGLEAGDSVVRVADAWGRSAIPGQARTRFAIEASLRPGDRVRFDVAAGTGSREVAV